MPGRRLVPSTLRAALAAALATTLLGGCAVLQPPPVPTMPRFGFRAGPADASCASDLSRAHGALAAAGAAAGDPATTAAAHAASASAMASYHSCLARAARHEPNTLSQEHRM